MGLPSAIMVCLTTACDGEKGPEGQFTVPTVCLTDQETTLWIIHRVYLFSVSHAHTRTHAHAARVCRSMTKKLESKIDSKGKANINNRTVVGGQLCVREHKRGADMVKGCEIQHLCNRPLAKIIQAWSEINVRAWKTWRNSMVSCGAVWQNRTYKKRGQIHEGGVCVRNAKLSDHSCNDHRCTGTNRKGTLRNTSINQLPQCAFIREQKAKILLILQRHWVY